MNREESRQFILDKINEDVGNFVVHTEEEHRKGSSYYVDHVIEVNEKNFPEVDRSMDGFYRTNNIVDDHNYGTDEKFTDLYPVERKEKITYYYQ